MHSLNKDNIIYYQEKEHHKQHLRRQIKSETIDILEINKNPMLISRKACQSLYQVQLKKQIQIKNSHEQKLNQSNKNLLPNLKITKNKSMSNYKERDANSSQGGYFQNNVKQKLPKANNNLNLNQIKGIDFYSSSDEYIKMKQKRLLEMNQTLRAQINQKKRQFQRIKSIKQMQNKLRDENLIKLKLTIDKQKSKQQKNKQNLHSQYQRQVKQLKIGNQKNNKFVYNNQTRHNPITNPIQYRIDNPYILKQIKQNKQNIEKSNQKY